MSIDAEVQRLLDTVTSPIRRRDAETLMSLFAAVTGEPPRVWYGTSIGFGQYHYSYPSGREGDAGAAGFAPRKAATTIYLPDGVGDHAELLSRLGRHTTGAVCLYITNLDNIDLGVLEQIIDRSYRAVTAGTLYVRRSPGSASSAG
ncbi:DUF1801 domain-containing protein [Leifsonia sp. NPDC058230]|uniref:DUF1801 domain-containing protein n=1 Tax=Leifsonia sp. NPDC058230 TaxID=3346391 RepID=UPI0036DF0A7D